MTERYLPKKKIAKNLKQIYWILYNKLLIYSHHCILCKMILSIIKTGYFVWTTYTHIYIHFFFIEKNKPSLRLDLCQTSSKTLCDYTLYKNHPTKFCNVKPTMIGSSVIVLNDWNYFYKHPWSQNGYCWKMKFVNHLCNF